MPRLFQSKLTSLPLLLLINESNKASAQTTGSNLFSDIPQNVSIGVAAGVAATILCCLCLIHRRGLRMRQLVVVPQPPALAYAHHNSQTELQSVRLGA